MQIAWLSDVHLDFLNKKTTGAFYAMLRTTSADAILLGGDMGEAHTVSNYLGQIALHAQKPVYFVLGNHDFYGASIATVRDQVQALGYESPFLHYLSFMDDVVELTPTTGLIGHDGWADLQYGDFKHSSVWMRDYLEIEELQGLKKIGLRPVLEGLGQEAAVHIQRLLKAAVQRYDTIIILTHVPPFKEACWHEGQISNDEFLPHFTCKAVGDVIRDIMAAYPQKQCRVLCGHTHGEGQATILPNLRVWTKGAEYGEIRPPTIGTFG